MVAVRMAPIKIGFCQTRFKNWPAKRRWVL